MSRLLPAFTCIFALNVTYFDIFARRALVRSGTPMILCLSNARSGDLYLGYSFVALRALVREIIPNTSHTHPPTYIHDLSLISIDCLTPASRLRRSAAVWFFFITFPNSMRPIVLNSKNRCIYGRVGFVVCREPGRISLYVALPRPGLNPSGLVNNSSSRSAVYRGENFAS